MINLMHGDCLELLKNIPDGSVDFAMDSSSMGVAAINSDRSFISIEKEDKYFEIAKERINNTNTEGK